MKYMIEGDIEGQPWMQISVISKLTKNLLFIR